MIRRRVGEIRRWRDKGCCSTMIDRLVGANLVWDIAKELMLPA